MQGMRADNQSGELIGWVRNPNDGVSTTGAADRSNNEESD